MIVSELHRIHDIHQFEYDALRVVFNSELQVASSR